MQLESTTVLVLQAAGCLKSAGKCLCEAKIDLAFWLNETRMIYLATD